MTAPVDIISRTWRFPSAYLLVHVTDHASSAGTARASVRFVHLSMQASPGKVALVVLHESTSRGFSYSNNKGTAISNCLFRLNGAAIVLSSRCAKTRGPGQAVPARMPGACREGVAWRMMRSVSPYS